MQLHDVRKDENLARHDEGRGCSLLSDPDLKTEYRWIPAGQFQSRMHTFFCKHGGTSMFAWRDFPDGRYDGIRFPTLDDLDIDELAAAPVKFEDGRIDRFNRAPDDIRLL